MTTVKCQMENDRFFPPFGTLPRLKRVTSERRRQQCIMSARENRAQTEEIGRVTNPKSLPADEGAKFS